LHFTITVWPCSIGVPLAGSEGKHYIRLSTASGLDVLENGVRRLNAAVEDREGVKQFLAVRPDIR
jgi:hypothetical protein